MDKITDFERIKGCIYGGAIGDALGYPIEFLTFDSINRQFSINDFNHYLDNVGKYSDDTQMTLYTATGLLLRDYNVIHKGINEDYCESIWKNYKDWFNRQTLKEINESHSWLNNIYEIGLSRAPGNTCLNALSGDICGSFNVHINNSKGNGGLMRVSPIPLYLLRHSELSYDEICTCAAKSSALTHTHPLGYIPSYAFSAIILKIFEGLSIFEAVKYAIKFTEEKFKDSHYINDFVNLLEYAINAISNDKSDVENIHSFGNSLCAEVCLAVAVYCSLKYPDSYEKAVTASIYNDGDSDTTGAVTGNIMGAFLGINSISDTLLKNVERCDVIEEITNDIFNGINKNLDQKLIDKYGTMKFGKE